jgi:DNA-directed RNA polymerase specialized sigma24 family protein
MDREERQRLQQQLVRLAEGDRSAFHPVFVSLWPMLDRFCARLLGNEADGADAAQQALVNVLARAVEFDARREALPWILGIAANEARTLRRRARRRREEALDGAAGGDVAATAPTPEDATVARDLEAAAVAALGALSATDARTLALAVGAACDEGPAVPGATFRKRVQRALERLRAAWRARHGEL